MSLLTNIILIVITDRGNIKASSVVIATHYPFINRPGYFFLKMHQERFYVGALKNWNKQGERLNGMYIDAYSKIERAKERWYSESTIEHLWSNQDCITPDSVPYIGKYSTKLPNFYVATGFNKWGMTTSMVSAMIISDMICRKYNPYRRVFYPQRLMPTGSYKIIADTAVTTINFSSEKLKITKDKIADIEKGKAGIISKDGQKIGVYRDQEDKYHYVTTKCPHLGCSLAWNPNELTWDCPCHGSRFDYYGKLINNPATRNVFDACSKHKK